MRKLFLNLKSLVDELEERKEKNKKERKDEAENDAKTKKDDGGSLYPNQGLTHINAVIKSDRIFRRIASGPKRPNALTLKRLSKNNKKKADDLNKKKEREAEDILTTAQQLYNKHMKYLKEDISLMLKVVEGKMNSSKHAARFGKIFNSNNARARLALIRVLKDCRKALEKAGESIIEYEDDNNAASEDIVEAFEEFEWPDDETAKN